MVGVLVGMLAGVSSFAFLETLDWATRTREANGWLLLLLPAAGLVIGGVYQHLGGRSQRGSALILEEIHTPTDWVPRRMAPLVFLGTVGTHLFGGSVGREGTALQMSASLADGAARVLRMERDERRLLLMAALGGGFGAVFGVPLAGAAFGVEVRSAGRVRAEALVGSLTASVVGHTVVDRLGHDHPLRPRLDPGLDGWLVLRVAAAGVVFGLVSALFVRVAHLVRDLFVRRLRYLPLRAAVGGAAVVALAALFGRDYLGLSLPLIDEALAGEEMSVWVPVLKILFTVVSLGCGLPGGEVTPLFVVGATAGSALAGPLGLEPGLLAAVGFVAVFAGAARTPLACTIMGAELFGMGATVLMATACLVSFGCSTRRGIYTVAGPASRADAPAPPHAQE
jgi:H+/Cl- antiporter ClcA